MQFKNQIAFFLALLMFTKMFAFDGQLLNWFTDAEDLTVVKHSCKMKDSLFSTAEADSLEESPSSLQLDYGSFCNSFFHFEVAESFEVFSFTPFHEITGPVLSLHPVERQITSPPPKTAA